MRKKNGNQGKSKFRRKGCVSETEIVPLSNKTGLYNSFVNAFKICVQKSSGYHMCAS